MSSFTRVGLTGGIASGKSIVAKKLASYGIPVVDMDLLSKNLLESDPQLQKEVIELLGPSILSDHKINRKLIREAIFNDPKKKSQLETLIHPRVRKQFDTLALQAKESGKTLIVCEAALLIESGYRSQLDSLIVVLAPLEDRIARLVKRDSISEELALKMVNAQVSDSERRKLANEVIENKSTIEELEKQVDQLILKWNKTGLLK